ncbi:putative iron-sulfur-binding oxidoreductase FadF [subsurface metagenome]
MKNTKPYTPPVLRLISTNIAKWGNPLGLKKSDCASWANGLQLPTKGKTILYTGCEYQMTAYIQSLVGVLKRVKFKDTLFSAFSGLQTAGGKLGVGLMEVYKKVTSRETEHYNQLLRMAALTLRKLGIDFAYLDGELYSGALLYEYGLFEEFEKQAKRVADQFKEAGVTKIIALTPHSAEILQQVYPKFIANFNFEVIPYVSIVAEALDKLGTRLSLPEPLTLTLHDPCHLARSLKVTEEPRKVLRAISNLNLKEVATNRELTCCCGAPCETIFPELSELIASRRVEELSATGAEVAATLCPFCYANLNRGVDLTGKKLRIVDFIEIIYQALEASHAGS